MEKTGVRTYSSLGDLPEGLRFDAIVTIDVVKYLALPWETMGQVRNLLNAKGWLYVATLHSKTKRTRTQGAMA